MKKTLLLGLGLLGGMTLMAQDMGTDVTPAGYRFSTSTEIPWLDNGYGTEGYGFTSGANFLTSNRSGKGVWHVLGDVAQEYWDKNNGLMGCAFVAVNENYNDMDALLEGFQLVDLGGEVGQVLCWQGKDSNLKECLEENYPDVDWSNVPDPTDLGIHQAFNLNFWLDPKDNFTKVSGYYRFRMIVNVCHHATDADIENEIYDFSGETVFKEIYQVNNQGNNTSFIYDGTVNEEGERVNTSTNDVGIVPSLPNNLFVKRTESGGLVENEYGDPVWDPTKWAIIDYYFNIAGDENGVDANGDATVPARIKITTVDTDLNGEKVGTKFNNLAVLIKEVSITKYDAELTQEIYDQNKLPFAMVVMSPGVAGETPDTPENPDDAGVENIVENLNAPVEFFNLQGLKVNNPENGVFIRKQGNNVSKVAL